MVARRSSVIVSGTVGAVAAAVVVAFGAIPQATAAAPVSQSTGRFLSGQIGSADFDQVAALNGESAVNTGGAAVTKQHSLSASLLGQQLLNLPGGVQLPGGGVLTLGAINQYAQADPDGSAHGASGAVTNSGAIGFGNGGAPQSDARLVLGDVPAIPGVDVGGIPSIGKLTVTVGALAATADQAKGSTGTQTGDYQLAGLKLTVSSPLLTNVIKQLTTQLDSLLGQLSGASGLPVAGGIVGSCDVSSMSQALQSFGDFSFAGGAITGSLTGGTLTIDLAQLLKSVLNLDLNNLPPNTHLFAYLAQALPQALANGLKELQGTLSDLFDKLTTLTDNKCTAPIKTVIDPVSTLGREALGKIVQPLSSSLSTGANSLSPLFTGLAKQLQQLIDPVVNVQERSSGTFTERALQLNLIGDPAARLNLASASVGPSQLPATVPTTPVRPAPSSPTPPPHLANTGATVVLTKIALFGLLGVCLGGALFGATIGVRRRMRGGTG